MEKFPVSVDNCENMLFALISDMSYKLNTVEPLFNDMPRER